MWQLARQSETLDLNSSYAYMLYCRDYPLTCRVATAGETVAGFVLGNIPPERPNVLFVWQIAVSPRHQGIGLASQMLDHIIDELSDDVDTVETTITDDNTASQRLFRSLAARWGDATVRKRPLFEESHFPDQHDAEPLYEIGPLGPRDSV